MQNWNRALFSFYVFLSDQRVKAFHRDTCGCTVTLKKLAWYSPPQCASCGLFSQDIAERIVHEREIKSRLWCLTANHPTHFNCSKELFWLLSPFSRTRKHPEGFCSPENVVFLCLRFNASCMLLLFSCHWNLNLPCNWVLFWLLKNVYCKTKKSFQWYFYHELMCICFGFDISPLRSTFMLLLWCFRTFSLC